MGHTSGLPRFVPCTQETCTSSNWTVVPSPPSPFPTPVPTPMPVPTPPTPSPSAKCPADSTIVDGACMWISGTGGFAMPMSAEAYCEYTNQGYFGYIWDSSIQMWNLDASGTNQPRFSWFDEACCESPIP